MSAAPAGSFAVLLAGHEDLENRGLADVVARARAVTRIDAARLVRRARGILGEGLAEEEAAGLARALLEAGIAALAVPTDRVAALPPALPFSGVEPGTESLVLHAAGEAHVVPWRRVRTLTGGYVRYDVLETIEEPAPRSPGAIWLGAGLRVVGAAAGAAVGLHLGHVNLDAFLPEPEMVERTVTREESRLILDVLLRDPPERFRADASLLDYSGLGKRREYASFANLRTLVEILREGAPDAARGPGVEAILVPRGLTSPRYDSLEDLEREERWLATVAPA